MKRLLSILLCLCLLAGLAGCGQDHSSYVPTGDGLSGDNNTKPTGGEDSDKIITLTYYPDRGLNPYLCTDFTNRALLPLLYQSLFVTDASYRVYPVLCKSYSVSKDRRTYIFYLEENITFSDGTPMTARDVVDCLNAAWKSSYYQGRMMHISAITLLDDGGIRIRTDTPYENLPLLLDIPIVKSTQTKEAYPLGTGPYVLEEGAGGTYLQRRTDWWCKAELPITTSAIPLMEATSITQIRDNFQFSGLDFALTDPSSDRYVDYRCDVELWNCESGIFLYIGCNEDSKVFTSPELRASLTYALNRDWLVSKFYRGFAISASLPASPLSPYYSSPLAGKYTYDGVKFAKAVKASGKEGSAIVFLVNSDDTLRVRVARAIADMLREGGLKVTMKEVGGTAYQNAVKNRQFDLYLGQTKLSPNMDLSAFFHLRGTLSYGGIDDVAAYYLCLQALDNQGNYYTLHKTVMDQGLLCPVLFCNYAVYTTRGAFTSLSPARDNPFFYDIGKVLADAILK